MYKITKELREVLINYLSGKPYIEIHAVIGELLKLEEIKDTKVIATEEEVKEIKDTK